MNKEQYECISKPFRNNTVLYKGLKIGNRVPTLLGYGLYPILVGYLFLVKDTRLIQYILIPGISFIVLSFIRSKLSFLRPYEILDIDPLIQKDTEGKSFPSRHAFSIFIIGTIWLPICMYVGIILVISGIILCICRVIGGVHFPRDVIVGAVLGILCGVFTIVL